MTSQLVAEARLASALIDTPAPRLMFAHEERLFGGLRDPVWLHRMGSGFQ